MIDFLLKIILWPLGLLLIRRFRYRKPDFVIGGADDPYLLRWWVTPWSRCYRGIGYNKQTRWQRFVRSLPSIYLHRMLRSDDDRALHDHPWSSISCVLKGGYFEVTPISSSLVTAKPIYANSSMAFRYAAELNEPEFFYSDDPGDRNIYSAEWRGAGAIRRRSATDRHRLVMPLDADLLEHAHLEVWSLFLMGRYRRTWGFWCKAERFVPWHEFVDRTDSGNVGRGCGET